MQVTEEDVAAAIQAEKDNILAVAVNGLMISDAIGNAGTVEQAMLNGLSMLDAIEARIIALLAAPSARSLAPEDAQTVEDMQRDAERQADEATADAAADAVG